MTKGCSVSLQIVAAIVDGKMTLMVPMEEGGRELSECTRGIAGIEGKNLRIVLPDWLADKVGVQDGSLVEVDNEGGKFNFVVVDALPEYTRRN